MIIDGFRMEMEQQVFKVLRSVAEFRGDNQTPGLVAEQTGLDEETVDGILRELQADGCLDSELLVTAKGLDALSPYKVRNAIILAAGMSTRFVPVSYELPKGLIAVKGEVMTERLIRQLQEAGITDIALVIGCMMEKFFYLRDKYHVKFIVNNEFSTKNTHSSIYAARDYLSSTYILCSDNYYPENMFHQYEYRAFYCSVFLSGTNFAERGFTFDDTGLITDTNKPSHDQWIMYGHAYYSNDFTNAFKPILESYYGKEGVENMYWETIYAQNVDRLPMWVQKCSSEQILEFDNIEELRAYDPEYISHNRIRIFENICDVLGCGLADIKDITPINKGLTNKSFKFTCDGKAYIYRHPGANATNVVNRKNEAVALGIAHKLKLDDTLIHVDPEEGWKISKYVDEEEEFDFGNKRHVEQLARKLEALHATNAKAGFSFDYRTGADRLIKAVRRTDCLSYRQLCQIRDQMEPIFAWLENDKWQISLCHNDLYPPNLLVTGNGLQIIDWEYAGDADIGYDICKLFAAHTPPFLELDEWLGFYYHRKTTEEEKLHLVACAAALYYYWYVWAIYLCKSYQNNANVSEYMMVFYDKMNQFHKLARKWMEQGSKA